ncbi:hypothetical protein MPER_05430, partial [Moniliophthora perniciosa FA553]
MGYPQWVVIIIHNLGSDPVKVKNVSLSWGKFHVDGDKDKEISKDQIERKVIGLDEQFQINSCGMEDYSPLLLGIGPWSISTHTWTISGGKPQNWNIHNEGANLHKVDLVPHLLNGKGCL